MASVPVPKPELIAYYPTRSPAAIVIEGSRPRSRPSMKPGIKSRYSGVAVRSVVLEESQRLYLNP